MYKYSQKSKDGLSTCDPKIQIIFESAIQVIDITILCGRRLKDAQEKAFEGGYSKVHWPDSAHNVPEPEQGRLPALSRAVDAVPYPIDWKDKERFVYLAGVVMGIAKEKRIKLEWGGHFKSFFDGAHYQLLE